MDLSGMQRLRESLVGLRAGLYARKSAYQGKHKAKGRSVKEQLDNGQTTANELGVHVVEQFVDDDRSASTYRAREREEFERMIEWIEGGKLDIVIAWSSTRLQRDLAVYSRLRDACKRHGVLWCYGGKVYDLSNKDDRFRTGLDALIGEREVDEMRDNILRTLRSNAVDGRPHAQAAYGYRRIYDARTGAFICTEAEPSQAPVIVELTRRVGNFENRTKIAVSFNKHGVTPPTRHWTKGMVKKLAAWHPSLAENEDIHPDWLARIEEAVDLRQEARDRLDADEDPVDIARDFIDRDEPLIMARWISATITAYAIDERYLGYRSHLGKVTNKEAWPALVDKSDHLRAVAAVKKGKEKRKYNQRPGKVIHQLSTLMICDICEIPVNSDKQHGYPRYSCAAPAPAGQKGYHASAQVSIVDPYVERKMFEWLSSPSFARAYAKGDEQLMKEIDEAEAEAKLLQAELDEFYEEAGAGRLSARALVAVEAEKLPKIEEAKKRARSLSVPPVVRELAGASIEEIEKAWKVLDLSQRRAIIDALVEVRLKPQGRLRDLAVEQFVSVVPKQLTCQRGQMVRPKRDEAA
ncbi:recombinase family protein [Streptomyces decoyicus]|uniref:recombinase family protein n=2 Tax=Streptomyces decoyicus TaxID=249567 RepID=UPI00386509D9|nr:recombinase family protein [Streptomyces decoyicus]